MEARLGSRRYGSIEDFQGSTASSSAALDLDVEAQPAAFPPRRRWVKAATVILGGIAAVSATTRAGLYTTSEPSSQASLLATTATTPSATTPLAFTAVNFYHVRDGTPAVGYYPWLKDMKLIEPHRDTTLSVANPREGVDYRWQIRGDSTASPVHTSASGAEAVVVLERENLDKNLVTLEEVDVATGAVSRRVDEFVMVKYVRREIRTLTDEEREELFDAMLELWKVRVDGGSGKETYGEGYSDIWAINRLHFKASSPQFCDHFHDGLGFLTSHGLLSNTFEYSLQQVNPKLTLPYWDFTIESSSTGVAAYKDLDDVFGSSIKTPLFQESWFGSTDPATDMVQDGRWAGTEVPNMVEGNPAEIEPDVYSKLRAPWTVNDRPFLTRGMGQMCHARAEEFYAWPTCEMHYNLVTAFADFYSWVWDSLYDPHGPVHIWIGGVIDCAETYSVDIEKLVGKDTARDLALLAFVHRKDMFRDGIFSCEGGAPVTEPPNEIFEAGVCGCHGYDLTQGDDYLKIFETLVFMEELVGDSDEDTKRQVVATLCSSVTTDGDQLQSSSSLDPSFWSTHPTMERLWMYTVLTGQITDYTWPDADVTYTASDGTVYTESISKYSEDCEGHRGGDVFPFDLLAKDVNDFTVHPGIKGSPEGGGNTFTNREVLAALDPRLDALPYVYDTFEWAHCEADGFDLKDAWRAKGETSASATKGAATGPPEPRTPRREEHRQSVDGRTVFEKNALRFPMYDTLEAKMASLREGKKDVER